MKAHEKARFDALLEWAQQHGAELHPSLEIYCDDVTRFSLRVKHSANDGLEGGFRAVSCPVSTTLSYLNALVDGPIDPASPKPQTGAADGAFPSRFLQSNPPHVIGRFFLIKEYLKGKDSFWWPYITTLPQPEHLDAWALPAFWPDDDIAYLEGTNAHVAIQEIQANVKREFKHARKLLKEEDFPNYQDYTQMLYKWAFSIFTSRSFRPSLILSTSVQDHITPLLLPAGTKLDDFSILQPLLDIANHSMTARYAWDTTSTSPPACRLVCRDPYAPGEQVYNNYGTKTNSELLLAYGFLLPATPDLHNDYVHVRKRQTRTHDEDDDDDDDDTKPKDFLISLRPLRHGSSLAGRARLSSVGGGPPSRLAGLPCFAHFEPALVDDLAQAVAAGLQERHREALERWNSFDGGREVDLTNSVRPPPGGEVAEVVERVRGVLGGKLEGDLERLMAVSGEGGEDGEDGEGEGGLPEPGNRNQVLAADYRRRCEEVLVAALEGLMVDG